MNYRFRLTAHSPTKGLFAIEERSTAVTLANGVELTLYPRDADVLIEASRFHFESRGFTTDHEALRAGEKLRQTRHVLIALLGLPMIVPNTDQETASIDDEVKRAVAAKGGEVLNSRSGLWVFPDDDKYVEFVVSASAVVTPSDPLYVLKALCSVSSLDLHIDEVSQRVLEILSFVSSSVSPVTKFLTTYLAVEQLIPRGQRSQQARELLQTLVALVQQHALPEPEKASLIGSLGHLAEESYATAFRRYVSRISSPAEIEGLPLPKLASDAIELRNGIAHHADVDKTSEACILAKALARFALGLVWTRNSLASVSIGRPPDRVRVDKFEVRLL